MSIFQQIALAVWRWLTPQVESALDPAYKARLDKVRADTLAVDKAEADAVEQQKQSDRFLAESVAIYAASEARRSQLASQIAENQRLEALDEIAIKESDARRKKIAEDLATSEAEIAAHIASRPDTDRIDQPLPGTKP